MAANINTAYREYIENSGSLENVISHGEGIVRYFSGKYGNGLDSEDLYQTGMLGILRAVRTFDSSRGVAFSTWASACVISEIRHYVRNEKICCRDTAFSDCFSEMDEDENTISYKLQKQMSFHLSLEDKIMIEDAIARLKPLQHKVIYALFYTGLTQQQTASILGITQRQVSRIKSAAIKILKSILDSDSFRLSDSEKSFRLIKNSK